MQETPFESTIHPIFQQENRSIRSRNYWQKRLAEFEPVRYITDYNLPESTEGSGKPTEYRFIPDSETQEHLHRVASSTRGRHIVLLTILTSMVYRISGQKDVLIFTPGNEEGERLPFPLIPFRSTGFDTYSLRDFLNSIKEHFLSDLQHKNFNVNTGRFPVIGLMVEEFHHAGSFDQVSPDLLFSFSIKNGFGLCIRYDKDKYTLPLIQGLATCYFSLFNALLANKEQSISNVIFAGTEEKMLFGPAVKYVKKDEGPASEEEQLLIEVWEQILGKSGIRVIDDLNLLGGDSIKYIQITARIRALGYEVSLNDIVTCQTIRELATKLTRVKVNSNQNEITGTLPLSPVQLNFFETPREHWHHFNQSVILHFKDGISPKWVEQIFGKIKEHHDALRMVFRQSGREIIQENKGLDQPLSLIVREVLPEDNLTAICNNIQESIDLSNGPLMKLGLFRMKDGCRLLIVIHHLVVDGVSWRILFEDIEHLYQQMVRREPLALPAKTDAFQKWSKAVRKYIKGVTYKRASAFWKEQLSRKFPTIPRDIKNGVGTVESSDAESFLLPAVLTTSLLTTAHKTFDTQINHLLLAAFMVAANRQYGLRQLKLDMEGHGREPMSKDLNINRTVGWFTTFYPVRLEMKGNLFDEIITHIRDSMAAIPANGFDYLIYRHLDEAVVDNMENIARSAVCFNYLGQFDGDINERSFIVSREFTGNETKLDRIRQYDWSITGMITGGCLEMQLAYSRNQYNQDTIQCFMKNYLHTLQDIINYCNTLANA